MDVWAVVLAAVVVLTMVAALPFLAVRCEPGDPGTYIANMLVAGCPTK